MTCGWMRFVVWLKPVWFSFGIRSTVRDLNRPPQPQQSARQANVWIGLAYNQMTSNMTSQAATMELHGAPNDVIFNLNPLALIALIPVMDKVVYPTCRKYGLCFTPLKRIYAGFLVAAMSMIAATVIQYYIYKTSPCGDQPSSCGQPAPINVWVQAVAYVLIALSEILAAITGYEYAYTKAPKNMKSLGLSLRHLFRQPCVPPANNET